MKNQEILFELFGSNKYEWLRVAANLYTSSRIIYNESHNSAIELNKFLEVTGGASPDEFPEASTYLVARMLAGMSIENLIKGIIPSKVF